MKFPKELDLKVRCSSWSRQLAGVQGSLACATAPTVSGRPPLEPHPPRNPITAALQVDLKRVNWAVMKEWIAKRVTELLGIEEEVLIGMIHNQLIDEQASGERRGGRGVFFGKREGGGGGV